jgi:DNA repair protein RadA/Sms
MVLAVLQARARVLTGDSDVFVATVGGARLHEPAGDLAMALAIASAQQDTVVPPQVVALGEIGLAGELRRVPDLRPRLMEAARLGFTVAVVPEQSDTAPGMRGPLEIPGIHIHAVPDLNGALEAVAHADPSQRPRRRRPPLPDF